MLDPALGFLCRCCPDLADLTGELRCLPSRWLTAGYVPKTFADGSTGWQKLTANHGYLATADEITTFYRLAPVRGFLQQLSATFAPFFPMSAAEWEADLRGTFNPIMRLYLWQTVSDVFDHYTKGKRFSVRARREYLDTFWLFFHHGPQAAAYEGREDALRSLTLGRVKRVVAELERHFQRRRRSVCH